MAVKTTEEIAQWLRRVHFRHKLLGGVNEDDVWRAMDKLQQEYAAVLDAQAERCGALLEERDRRIAELEGRKSGYGALLEEQNRRIAELEGRMSGYGATLEERDRRIAELEGRMSGYGATPGGFNHEQSE